MAELGKLALLLVGIVDVNPPQIAVFPLGQLTHWVLESVVSDALIADTTTYPLTPLVPLVPLVPAAPVAPAGPVDPVAPIGPATHCTP